jgi:hypothetical protein
MRISRHAQSQLEESIFSIFQGIPELCGFTVQAGSGGVELTDVGLFPVPDEQETQLICSEIRERLADLINERPETGRLVAGRTFARALH